MLTCVMRSDVQCPELTSLRQESKDRFAPSRVQQTEESSKIGRRGSSETLEATDATVAAGSLPSGPPKPAPRKRNERRKATELTIAVKAELEDFVETLTLQDFGWDDQDGVSQPGRLALGRHRLHASAFDLPINSDQGVPTCQRVSPRPSAELLGWRPHGNLKESKKRKNRVRSAGRQSSLEKVSDPLQLNDVTNMLLEEAQSLPNCYVSSDQLQASPFSSTSNIRLEFEMACAALQGIRADLVQTCNGTDGRAGGSPGAELCIAPSRKSFAHRPTMRRTASNGAPLTISSLDEHYWKQQTMPWSIYDLAGSVEPLDDLLDHMVNHQRPTSGCSSYEFIADLDDQSPSPRRANQNCQILSDAQVRLNHKAAGQDVALGFANTKSPLSLRSVRGVVDKLIQQAERQIPSSTTDRRARRAHAATVLEPFDAETLEPFVPACEDACTQTSPLSMSCSSSFSWRSERASPDADFVQIGQPNEGDGKTGDDAKEEQCSSSYPSLSSVSDESNMPVRHGLNDFTAGALGAKWPNATGDQTRSFFDCRSIGKNPPSLVSAGDDHWLKGEHCLPAICGGASRLNSQEAFQEGLRLLLLASASGFDDPKFADILNAIEPFAEESGHSKSGCTMSESGASAGSAKSPDRSPSNVPSSNTADSAEKSDSQVSSAYISTSSPETPSRMSRLKMMPKRFRTGHFCKGVSLDSQGPSTFSSCFSDPCLKSSEYGGPVKAESPLVRTWGPKLKSLTKSRVEEFASKLQLRDRTDQKKKFSVAACLEYSTKHEMQTAERAHKISDQIEDAKFEMDRRIESHCEMELSPRYPNNLLLRSTKWLKRQDSLARDWGASRINVVSNLIRSKSVSARRTRRYDDGFSVPLSASNHPMMISSLGVLHFAEAQKYALIQLTAALNRNMPFVKPSGFSFGVQRFFKRKRSPERTLPLDYSQVFGAPFSVIIKREGEPLPQCIHACMRFVENRAASSVGIFRKSGVRSRIQKLKSLCDNGESIDFDQFQVWDVADVIKLYFRELPEPLLTNSLSETFLYISLYIPERSKVDAIRKAILLMPDENREVLYSLLHFLAAIAKCSKMNQMDAQNLAICFAPSLFYIRSLADVHPNWRRKTITSGFPSEKELKENRAAQMSLATMIKCKEQVFQLPVEVLRSCGYENGIPNDLTYVTSDQGAKFDINRHYDVCYNSMIKEHNEKWKGWSVESTLYGVEVSTKKVADSFPLKLWRCWTEVQAPPKEVLFRILCERDLFDPKMGSSKVLKKMGARCDVFQYDVKAVYPHPSRDFCLLRMWETDMPEFHGGCFLVEFTVDHESTKPIGKIKTNVMVSRYVIEPAGRGRSRLTYVSRIDLRGRCKAWYCRNYGALCARQIAHIRDSFLLKILQGPETKI